MKYYRLFFCVAAATILAACSGKAEPVFTVTVTNPSDTDRQDIPVVINLHEALGEKAATILSAEVISTVSDIPASGTSSSGVPASGVSSSGTSAPAASSSGIPASGVSSSGTSAPAASSSGVPASGVSSSGTSAPAASSSGVPASGASVFEAALPDGAPSGLLPSQLDDLDGDLIPDELAFTCNIPASSTATFKVVCSAVSPQRSFPPRTAAFMKVWDRKYRYPYINSIEYQGRNTPLSMYDAIYGHGAQWESELVGFRVYMDHRQSIDIYGKPHPQLVLDQTNFYSTREDIAAGRGCDILFAGPSVGAGSFRGYVDGQPTYVDSVEARGQRVIASGPVRAIVEVTDRNWLYADRLLQMRQLYTIYAGHRDVQVDIQLKGEDVNHLTFCTGVQKLELENEGLMDVTQGLVGSWGKNVPDKAATDLVEGVGLGVTVENRYLTQKKEDEYNYLTVLHPVDNHIRYHLAICALMEENGFKDSKSWFDWLRSWQKELTEPVTIKVSKH